MLSCYSKVVVPYDGSELSEKALRTAIKLVSADKRIELHVLHIIKPFNTLEMLEKNYKAAFYMRVERAMSMLREVLIRSWQSALCSTERRRCRQRNRQIQRGSRL